MKFRTSSAYVLIVAILAGALPNGAALAQATDERTATERRLQELRDQIANYEDRLSETAEAEQASEQKLKETEREIAIRNELITNYQRRLDELSAERDSLRRSMHTLERDIAELKRQYQHRAAHAYKYGRLHDLALILSARSINQMLIRARYLHRFTEQRRDKLQGIQEATADLEARRQRLEETQTHTEELLREAENERKRLTRLRQNRQQLLAELREQRQTLDQNISENQSTVRELEAKLRELIAAADRRRARAGRGATSAEEFAEISGSFRQHQGRLPWPAGGVVVEPFGETVNPVYGTVTPNPGILIATNAQEEVRAVFEGEVIAVDVMPEYGRYVLVQHGDFQSFYGNFSMLYVGEGDRLQTGQLIGRAGTDAEPKGAGVFFALFQEGTALDPDRWLRDR